MPSMATGRSAPSCSAKSFMETRRPSSSFMFRLPGEMACAQSLLPFHSATASACMVSQLSTSACILIQGQLMDVPSTNGGDQELAHAHYGSEECDSATPSSHFCENILREVKLEVCVLLVRNVDY
ncbi:unnamed protein product [Sphagnum balticum]